MAAYMTPRIPEDTSPDDAPEITRGNFTADLEASHTFRASLVETARRYLVAVALGDTTLARAELHKATDSEVTPGAMVPSDLAAQAVATLLVADDPESTAEERKAANEALADAVRAADGKGGG
jgi:hypothetical protein